MARARSRASLLLGAYDDAINAKRNAVILFLVNHFGGIGVEAAAWVFALRERAKAHDTTAYVQGAPTKWVEHWMQRLSLAAVAADARRCLRRLRRHRLRPCSIRCSNSRWQRQL